MLESEWRVMQMESRITPVQIRPDLTVRIAGIPHDLTLAEAEKISRVVLALAYPKDITECIVIERPDGGLSLKRVEK